MRRYALWGCALAVLFLAQGCLGSGQAPMRVSHYSLEYPPAAVEAAPLNASLRVLRFSVAPEYNTSALVYRDGPYRRSEDRYHRWRANPGDLAGAFLVRDLRRAGVFLAVGSEQEDAVPADYLLEGSVDEFYELDGEAGWSAVLGLTVSLLRAGESDPVRMVLFQRAYRAERPCAEKRPAAVAAAMSEAMAEVSARVIGDVAAAVRTDLAGR